SVFEKKLCEAVKMREDVQKIIFSNVYLKKDEKVTDVGPLNFFLNKGEVLGIYAPTIDLIKEIHEYFEEKKEGTGQIRIFGSTLQPFHLKVFANVNIDEKLNEQTKLINELTVQTQNLGLDKDYLNDVLTSVALINQKDFKFKDLTEGQLRRYFIVKAILTGATIILFRDFSKGLNNTEKGKLLKCVEKLSREFHITFFIQDEVNFISKFDRILVIGKKGSQIGFGTYSQLLDKLPRSNYIIDLELNRPISDFFEKLSKISDLLLIIEARKFEKYRIFAKNNIENKIKELIQKFGKLIFHIKKSNPTLFDYLQFMEQNR
ncbi:MAG: hypothetical protein ACTSVY_16005, partial [Candidatus Helarchaeota archaeon]